MDNPVSLEELYGKIISSPNVAASTGYIPVFFEFDNNSKFASGSFAEVYLISSSQSNGLSVPASAITEELGTNYVYVKTGPESYEKRLVKLGESDGKNTEIVNGLKEGENVVTEGVMFVKLAGNSTEIPDGCSGHSH